MVSILLSIPYILHFRNVILTNGYSEENEPLDLGRFIIPKPRTTMN